MDIFHLSELRRMYDLVKDSLKQQEILAIHLAYLPIEAPRVVSKYCSPSEHLGRSNDEC